MNKLTWTPYRVGFYGECQDRCKCWTAPVCSKRAIILSPESEWEKPREWERGREFLCLCENKVWGAFGGELPDVVSPCPDCGQTPASETIVIHLVPPLLLPEGLRVVDEEGRRHMVCERCRDLASRGGVGVTPACKCMKPWINATTFDVTTRVLSIMRECPRLQFTAECDKRFKFEWPSKPDSRCRRMAYTNEVWRIDGGWTCYEDLSIVADKPLTAVELLMIEECGQVRGVTWLDEITPVQLPPNLSLVAPCPW